MIVDSRNVFMNRVREDGEGAGFPLSMSAYGVGIDEAEGFGSGGGGGGGAGSGDGGHESKASFNEVIIDRKFGENDLEIFLTKVVG